MVKNFNGTTIPVKVFTGSKKFGIEFDSEKNELNFKSKKDLKNLQKTKFFAIIIKTKSPAEKGRANLELEKELKKFFDAEIKILNGFKSKKKLIWIDRPQKEIEAKLKSLL